MGRIAAGMVSVQLSDKDGTPCEWRSLFFYRDMRFGDVAHIFLAQEEIQPQVVQGVILFDPNTVQRSPRDVQQGTLAEWDFVGVRPHMAAVSRQAEKKLLEHGMLMRLDNIGSRGLHRTH
jgi:hypothetical protein